MANFNYGNSFNSYEGENVGVERISVWKSVREFFPGGAVLAAEDYEAAGRNINGNALKVGDIVPAGTRISVSNPGGKADFTDTKCIGLTYEDVVLGNDASTFTIVTSGEFLESRFKGIGLSDDIRNRLFGRISFIKEV